MNIEWTIEKKIVTLMGMHVEEKSTVSNNVQVFATYVVSRIQCSIASKKVGHLRHVLYSPEMYMCVLPLLRLSK